MANNNNLQLQWQHGDTPTLLQAMMVHVVADYDIQNAAITHAEMVFPTADVMIFGLNQVDLDGYRIEEDSHKFFNIWSIKKGRPASHITLCQSSVNPSHFQFLRHYLPEENVIYQNWLDDMRIRAFSFYFQMLPHDVDPKEDLPYYNKLTYKGKSNLYQLQWSKNDQ